MSGKISTVTLVEWLQRLVRRPSEQSDAMEQDPAIQSFVRDEVKPLVEELGLQGRLDAYGNLIVDVGPENGGCTLATFAYAMTHPRSTMPAPFDGEVIETPDGAYVRGRGISEQKSSLVASLAAFAEFAKSGYPRHRLSWVLLTAGETGRHDAIAAAIKEMGAKPRFALVVTGSSGDFSLGNRGRLDVEVIIEGRPSHSSTPWKGIDVTRGVEQILRKASLINEQLPKHPALGPASLTCTSIRTRPDATHTIQSHARLVYDRRLLPGETPEAVLLGLKEMLTVEPPLRCSVTAGSFMYGAALEPGSELLVEIAAALKSQNLAVPKTYYADGALDVGYLHHHNTQALKWGPGDPAQFHTDDERVAVAEVVLMVERYNAVYRHFANLP
jgi:acetylornithine deacetylase